jgi:hypothetical protein
MQDADDPRLRECLAAFAARDYTACYVAAIRDSAPPLESGHPVFRQLVAICLQRLGQAEDLEATCPGCCWTRPPIPGKSP